VFSTESGISQMWNFLPFLPCQSSRHPTSRGAWPPGRHLRARTLPPFARPMREGRKGKFYCRVCQRLLLKSIACWCKK
jgi:hypothetical protein